LFIFVHSSFRKKRLDEVCLEQYQQYSRSIIQSWILQGNHLYFFISKLECRHYPELALVIKANSCRWYAKKLGSVCILNWFHCRFTYVFLFMRISYLPDCTLFLFLIFIITYLFDDKCVDALLSSFVAKLTMLAAIGK